MKHNYFILPRGYGKTQGLIKYIYDEYIENGQKVLVITDKKELSPTMNNDSIVQKVSDMSFWEWYPTEPIIEPKYVDVSCCVEHFRIVAEYWWYIFENHNYSKVYRETALRNYYYWNKLANLFERGE